MPQNKVYTTAPAYNVIFPIKHFERVITGKKWRGPDAFNPMLRLQAELRRESELVMCLAMGSVVTSC